MAHAPSSVRRPAMAATATVSALLLLLLAVVQLAPSSVAAASYPLTVHLVPHSHEDAGYEKTIDQYYYGSNQSIRATGVQYRMDTIVPTLEADPSRRFVQVEMAFFHPWWLQQTTEMRERFKRLVESGQMEMANGGWCMHDEATTIAVDQIDQMTLGHKFLLDTFGPDKGVPRTGWSIDPFGHASTSNTLYKAYGFDSLYVCRIDWEDKIARMLNQQMEWLWDSSPSLGSEASTLWGGTFVMHYGAPPTFCLDPSCDGGGDEPIMDDPRLEDNNVLSRIDTFLALMVANAPWFQGSDVLFTMGGDFLYTNAARNFKEMDKLIKYANEAAKGKIIFRYSTPAEYTAAKQATANITWPVKGGQHDDIIQDDFFPYADQLHSQWVGFYTSRPLFKRLIRWASAGLQAAKQLEFFGGRATGATQGPTRLLQEAVAVAQHHDGLTGTEMQHVAYDYALRVAVGGAAAQEMQADVLGKLVTPDGSAQMPKLVECVLAYNESVCPFTQAATDPSGKMAGPLLVLLYNSQAHVVSSQRVSLAVERPDLIVVNSQQQKVAIQQIVDNEAADPEGTGYASRVAIRRRNAERQERHQQQLQQQLQNGGSNKKQARRRKGKSATVAAEQLEAVPSRYTLTFMSENVGPLGVESYFVVPTNGAGVAEQGFDDAKELLLRETQQHEQPLAKPQKKSTKASGSAGSAESSSAADDVVSISNSLVSLSFSSTTGLLVGYTDLSTGEVFALGQEWLFYESFVDPTGASPNAGAYISRFSNDNVPFPIGATSGAVAQLSVVSRGPVVWEVHQQFADWCVQTVRLVAGSKAVEVEWSVGPVPLTDNDGVDRGKEVILRFNTAPNAQVPAPFNTARGINNGATWFTDSNGREFVQRRRDYRATWPMTHEEPVTSNYAPINAAIFMNDAATVPTGQRVAQLTVLTDRSQGGASITNNTLEIMVHRRLVADDDKGVHEPLNETTSVTPYPNMQRIGPGIVVKGTHTLLLSSQPATSVSSFAADYRPLMASVYSPLIASYASLPGGAGADGIAAYLKTHQSSLSLAGTSLPPNLDLMTLQSWDNGTALVRLAHRYARGEAIDAGLSQAVTFDLATLLSPSAGTLVKAEELSITANQPAAALAERNKKSFANLRRDPDAPAPVIHQDTGLPLEEGQTVVTISAMQIRTFQLTYA